MKNTVFAQSRPGVNPPSTIPNPIPVDFLNPNPIPVNLAMIPNPIPVIFPSAIPTPIPISSYWYEIIVREFRISHKTAQVKGPDWLKTSQTEVSLWYMSPVPVITVTRLVDLLNQAIHTAVWKQDKFQSHS